MAYVPEEIIRLIMHFARGICSHLDEPYVLDIKLIGDTYDKSVKNILKYITNRKRGLRYKYWSHIYVYKDFVM